jgi:hypothetical protein
MPRAALLALFGFGLPASPPESFAEALVRELEGSWADLSAARIEEFPARDKHRFFYVYEGAKRTRAPSRRDLEEALEAVRGLEARHGANPDFRWRCEEIYGLLAWDLGRREEGIGRYRAALDGYPEESVPDPKEHSAFQHVANEIAARIADEKGLEEGLAFLLARFREDPRFVFFYFPFWEEKLGEADDDERFEAMRESVRAIYREKAERETANRAHLLRYLAELDGEKRPLPRRAGGDPRKRYFLLVPPSTSPEDVRHLVLVMPGVPGPARLSLPFLSELHAALGRKYVLAVLSPPTWGGEQAKRAPWPTEASRARWPEVGFSSEAFLRAVLEDVRAQRAFSVGRAIVFGWSASGPAAYAAASGPDVPYEGFYVLSSPFDPGVLDLSTVRGRRFYLQHGREDPETPARASETAAEVLRRHGATVRLDLFEGGPAFSHRDPKYAVRLALSWLESGDP